MGTMNKINVGVLTISDRCYQGLRTDKSGPALVEAVKEKGWRPLETALVSDDRQLIRSMVLKWCDDMDLDLILMTGGTGLGPRDVTPEVTRVLFDKELPGLSETMRLEGRHFTPLSILSRSVCGIRKKSIIITLPGSPSGAVQSFQIIQDVIPHALGMIKGEDHHHTEAKSHAHTV